MSATPQTTARPDGNAEALLDVVRGLVAEIHAGDRYAVPVTLASRLDRDLGLDSLTRVELIVRVERRFGVRVPEAVLGTAQTAGDLLAALDGLAPPSPTHVPAAAPLAAGEPAPATVRTLVEALRWHAERHPAQEHVIFCDAMGELSRLTYGALNAAAEAAASALKARGVRSGEAVALMLPTGPDFLASFFGILLAGAIPVPLYPPAGTTRIADHLRREAGILVNCGARFLVTVAEIKPFARWLRALAPAMTGVLVAADLEARAGSGTQGRDVDIALLQYTSGSTGNPKGVVLTHANLLANILAMGQALRIAPHDVFVSWLPLYHDMGLIGAWLGTLYYGMPLVLMSPLSFLPRPQVWLRAIDRYRGTLSGGPNFAYELCLKRISDSDVEGLDLRSWRFAFNGAEPVSPSTMTRFCERFRRYGFDAHAMAPVYGLAECSVGLAFSPPGRAPAIDRVERRVFVNTGHALPAPPADETALQFAGCGYPIAGHRVRVVDAAGNPLPERREGRIEFSGPSATAGYFHNDEATRTLFDGTWLDTGDLGYIAEGELYPTGRVKDIVIRAGRHLHPQELEEAVGRLPGVRQGCVAVFGTMDRRTGTERLIVVAETRPDAAAGNDELVSRINALAVDLLGSPADHVVLAAPHTLLKTSSGKVRRAETRMLYEHGLLGAGMRARILQLARLAWNALAAHVRARAHRLAEAAYAAHAWSMLGICAAAACAALVWPLPGKQRRRIARAFAQLFLKSAGLSPDVAHLERLAPGGPCIYVANHASYVDSIVLLAALPADFRFVAKRGLTKSWILRFALHAVDAILVESLEPARGVEAADALMRAVEGGESLGVFPEGTFVRTPGVLPFRLGAFLVAARAHVPVVPIALAGTRNVLHDGSWLPRKAHVSAAVGVPLYPRGETFDDAVALRDAARAAILRDSGEAAAM